MIFNAVSWKVFDIIMTTLSLGMFQRQVILTTNFYSIDRWLVPLPLENAKKTTKIAHKLPHQFTMAYLRNNYVFLSFLTIYIIINVGLFVSRAIEYKHHGVFIILARACGTFCIEKCSKKLFTYYATL